MTYVVAFDGTDLSESALSRADDLADDEGVVAVCVVPRDSAYAREHGWIESESGFAPEDVADRLGERVAEIAPGAEFRPEFVDAYSGPYTISRRLRKVIRELDPGIVFLGSENAGRIVTPVSSVGSKVASDLAYDIYLVRVAD